MSVSIPGVPPPITDMANVGNIMMDMDDAEQIDLLTLGGADIVTVNNVNGTDRMRLNIQLGGE